MRAPPTSVQYSSGHSAIGAIQLKLTPLRVSSAQLEIRTRFNIRSRRLYLVAVRPPSIVGVSSLRQLGSATETIFERTGESSSGCIRVCVVCLGWVFSVSEPQLLVPVQISIATMNESFDGSPAAVHIASSSLSLSCVSLQPLFVFERVWQLSRVSNDSQFAVTNVQSTRGCKVR